MRRLKLPITKLVRANPSALRPRHNVACPVLPAGTAICAKPHVIMVQSAEKIWKTDHTNMLLIKTSVSDAAFAQVSAHAVYGKWKTIYRRELQIANSELRFSK